MELTENGNNFFEKHSPGELVEQFGTPLYVYSEKILRARCHEIMNLAKTAGLEASYSVKANSNPFLLTIIREEGLHADAMSPGELFMDKLAGWKSDEIFYISNNNGPAEMLRALNQAGLVSVDSLSQLDMFGSLNPGGSVMIRINPGIGAGHSEKVITGGGKTKFGISMDRLGDILLLLDRHNLKLAGLNQHIGSLFMEAGPYIDACGTLLNFVGELPEERFRQLEILDFGGGFGIPYHKGEKRLDLGAMARNLKELLEAWRVKSSYAGRFLIEPGRYVVAECGCILGQVTSVKENAGIHYTGTDIGFNVLMRPVLYDAYHEVEALENNGADLLQTITGNICESGDILAKDRLLPPLKPGNLLLVRDAGAYGFSMASNYNERLLPAEVLLCQDGSHKLIRRRQTLEDLAICLPSLEN